MIVRVPAKRGEISRKGGGRGKQEMGAEGEQSKMRGSMGYNSVTCGCSEVFMVNV